MDKTCIDCDSLYEVKSNRQLRCADCSRLIRLERSKKWEIKNNWKENNKDKVKEYKRKSNKKYYENNRDKVNKIKKRYYDGHRDKVLEAARERRKKNAEKERLRYRVWSLNNKDKIRLKNENYKDRKKIVQSEWNKNNWEKVLFISKTRKRRVRYAEGKHTLDEWNKLKELFNYICPCCGKSEPEIKLTEDHIIPISKGGSNYIHNIQPLCGSCNCKKFTKTIEYKPLNTSKNV